MEPEAISNMLAELAREHAPEATFSPPLQVGETTIICAATVSCLAGSRGANLVLSLRSTPCAVIVIQPGQCTVLPVAASGPVERLLDLVPRLLELIDARSDCPHETRSGTQEQAGWDEIEETRPVAGSPSAPSQDS